MNYILQIEASYQDGHTIWKYVVGDNMEHIFRSGIEPSSISFYKMKYFWTLKRYY